MRKTLQDVAKYLKEILVPKTDQPYAINPLYADLLEEEKIRKGVLNLRDFLVKLYDTLYATGNTYDTCTKVAHEYENRTSLSVYYPFLHHVSIVLIKIGYFGKLSENSESIFCNRPIFNEKLSASKNQECLKFLMGCGLQFEGIDLQNKKLNPADIQSVTVTYPNNPGIFTGMKALAIAEIDHGTLLNQDVFLRCDYSVLKREQTDALTILKNTLKPLSDEVQSFVLQLHQRYLEKGLSCSVEVKGFHIYIMYCYKRKDIWGINSSLTNGYHINVKSTKMEHYPETIQSLSPVLQELIAKGYGCGRKREIGHCDGGCRGIPIDLDHSILDLREDIFQWFDQELFFLQKK